MIKKICILSDIHDWHSSQIEKYLESRKVKVIKANFDDLNICIKSNMVLFKNKNSKFNFNGVWVRFIDGGTIEEITYKLSILHLLKEKGIYVHNCAEVIEKTIDKFRTTAILSLHKVKTPKTWVVSIRNRAKEILLSELSKGPILFKPLLGSRGKGIKIFYDKKDVSKIIIPNKIFYLQEFIGNPKDKIQSDIRVFVSNHKFIKAIERTSYNMITNASLGAKVKIINVSDKLKKSIEKISKIFNLGYGGIDFKYYQNKYFLLEINSIPSWHATQKVIKSQIVKLFADDFIKKCK